MVAHIVDQKQRMKLSYNFTFDKTGESIEDFIVSVFRDYLLKTFFKMDETEIAKFVLLLGDAIWKYN